MYTLEIFTYMNKENGHKIMCICESPCYSFGKSKMQSINDLQTSEDFNEMLLYHGGRGGDIGGGNYVMDEEGVPRNSSGQI